MELLEDKMFSVPLYSAGGALVILIMVGSVFPIYNSFSIPLDKCTHQFSILMSVGAIEKQLHDSVLFEGFCIGATGIPTGILIDIPSIQFVLSVVTENFSNTPYSNASSTLKVFVLALVAAAVVSMVTVLISTYIPAKKAADTSVMECIR